MMRFVVTEEGVPFGILTWDGAWSWDGRGRRCPVISNRVMHPARRSPYLVRLGLPITATHAEELTRTWGCRATDTVEIVPVDQTFVPLHAAAHLPVGTRVVVTRGSAFVDGQRVGRLPRSFPESDRFNGTIIANTDGVAILRRDRTAA